MKGYKKDSVIDFGIYKGYKVGMIYTFDPSYIEWCINNVDKFYIIDLNELKELSVINEGSGWKGSVLGPSEIGMDAFETIEEAQKIIKDIAGKHIFTNKTLENNTYKIELAEKHP